MQKVFRVAAAALAIISLGHCASAKTIYVNCISSTDGPGDTWEHAYRKISSALAAATAGDQVWVKGGTYTEAITIPSGVALYGSFAGTETTPSQRILYPMLGYSENVSWLSGIGTYYKRMVAIPDFASASTRLDGFQITNCSYGGIRVGQSSSPVITNCIIGNCDEQSGGGIYVSDNATPLITKNYISGCESGLGAAIYVNRALPTITHNTFNDNTASYGGAIYLNQTGSLLIANNKMWNNLALERGGAVVCDNSDPIITGNLMHKNAAYHQFSGSTYGTGQGGAIYCLKSHPVINNNTMCWNSAFYDGGAIFVDSLSGAIVQGNIFYYNQAGAYGFTICNFAATDAVQADYNNSYGYFVDGYYKVTKGPNETSVEPVFISNDWNTPDYRLATGSPCVNTGRAGAAGLQSTDADGNPRVVGPLPDKGAFEFQMQITPLVNDKPISQTTTASLYWFEVRNAMWAAVGVAPQSSADLQASTTVWMTSPYAEASSSGTARDFIVANGTRLGNAFHYAQVDNNSGTASVEAESQPRSIGPGIPESGSFASGEVLEAFQASLQAGKTYHIVAHPTSGTADPSLFVFKPSRYNGSRASADWASTSADPAADEQLYAICPESGTYCIVVVNEGTGTGTFNLSITEKPPVTISGKVTNFAGSAMYRISVQANNGGGSATTDLSGNYSLSVPYYWSGTVSAVRLGWSYAPSFRTYKDLVSNVSGANFTGGMITSVGGTKLLPDGRSIYLENKPVTAVFGDDAYIEDLDRAGGIRVIGGATSAISVTLGGVLTTINGERCISSPSVIGAGKASVYPLYVRGNDLGGTTTGYAPGIPGSSGPNNIGLLVRTSGVVTGVDGTVFYVDGGAAASSTPGSLGVRVDTQGLTTAPAVGKHVTVTGIGCVWMNGSTPTPELRPRSAQDVQQVYRVALIHGSGTILASDIERLLEQNLVDVTLVADSAVLSTDLRGFDGLIIADDSLAYKSSKISAVITESGLPVLAIGSGGSLYLDTRKLFIGWSNSTTQTGPSTVVPRVSTSPIFHTPNEVYASTLTPYATDVSATLIYMPDAVRGVIGLASPPNPAGSYYVLCSQSRCTLWGYSGGVRKLTTTGVELFVNALYYTLRL